MLATTIRVTARVRSNRYLADLARDIEPDEQARGFRSHWIVQERGVRAGALRHRSSGAVRKTQREGMAIDLLLDAEGVCRAVDTKFLTVDQCRNHFGQQRHSGTDIDGQAEAGGERVYPRQIQNAVGA